MVEFEVAGSEDSLAQGLTLRPCLVQLHLFRQNTCFRNKKNTLTCQGGTGCYRAVNYQPGS